jgi:hypothetical protein
MLVTVLLDVVVPMGCVGACALIGRHYERRCAEHRAFCDDMEHNAHRFAAQARLYARHLRRTWDRDTETDIIPVPESHASEPALHTHDRLFAGSTRGRHALPDEQPPLR